MIGVMVPSVFAQNSGNPENTIYFTVELNKENYKLGDQSYLKITTDQYVPNTPFSLYSNNERIDTCTIEENSLECYMELPIWKVLERSHATGGYSDYFYSYGDSITESYKFDVYYGDYNNNFGKKSVKINFSPNTSYHVDFVSKHYALDKFDIGTSFKISELSIRTFGVISWFDDKICIDSDFTLCPVGIEQRFSMDGANSATLEWHIFDNDESAKLFYSTYFDILINDPHSEWNWSDITPYVLPNEFGEGISCDFLLESEQQTKIVCLKDNLIIYASEYGNTLKIIEYAIKKINSSQSLKSIASFVDQSKDPQHYLDRYNNEPSYKQWFDENYSQYSSIYEAVGIDQEDYELKIKANDVRKLINENYVPTSSELGSKWLWTGSGGTDGYSEYCLTLNCDGYSHTTYRPVRDVVNWDQHLELTILFFEDGDNLFDIPTEVQCEDHFYYDCGRVYPNYQCITPSVNYGLGSEAKRNLYCDSEYFKIIVKELKTECIENQNGITCGDFENFSVNTMKVVLEKIARNSNVELTNNVESTIAHTPEPEYVPEPAFTPESVIEQEVNCGPGIESVNGICEIIQTEEKSSNGGGCLIATATYGSEMSPQVQQLRELRDNQLMNTESGSAFMSTFNNVYYSFSPTIADYERESPIFKEIVKVGLTPMLSSLSLMESANSESEVLGMGLSVIMLNLGMYLAVPAAVIMKIRKLNL